MSLMRPMDPAFPIDRQISIVSLASPISRSTDEQAPCRRQVDGLMKRQPGFISTQMHRAVGESPAYLNYAIWESTTRFPGGILASGVSGEASRPILSSAVASPHLFQKVAVPGICAGVNKAAAVEA